MSGGLDFAQILLESGIVVKAVLLLLIVASVFSWAIIFQKRKSFKNVKKQNGDFFDMFSKSESLEEVEEKLSGLEESTYREMFKKAFDEYSKIKTKLGSDEDKVKLSSYFKEAGTSSLERSLKQGASQSNLILEKRLSTLASVSSVAPFIGLFGTVWGIIDAFSGLASGGGSIEAVAPGIAEALVATAVGLAAAIPANWFFNIFTTELTHFHSGMEDFGQEFLNLVDRSHLDVQKLERRD